VTGGWGDFPQQHLSYRRPLSPSRYLYWPGGQISAAIKIPFYGLISRALTEKYMGDDRKLQGKTVIHILNKNAGKCMTVPNEPHETDLMQETVKLVTKWNFNETQLENGMTAYTKPIFGKNGNITSLIFLFPFADPSFHSIMMEIVAYLPIVVPEKDRLRVADFVARMALSTVSFTQIDMESGIVNLKQRIFLKDTLYPNDFLVIIGDQVYSEADILLPVLNKMVYNGLSAREAMAEADANLGYSSA
jgi:hypothetical protein